MHASVLSSDPRKFARECTQELTETSTNASTESSTVEVNFYGAGCQLSAQRSLCSHRRAAFGGPHAARLLITPQGFAPRPQLTESHGRDSHVAGPAHRAVVPLCPVSSNRSRLGRLEPSLRSASMALPLPPVRNSPYGDEKRSSSVRAQLARGDRSCCGDDSCSPG